MCGSSGPDIWSPPTVVARMLSARARAKFLPPAQRAWTTTPPPGWEPVPTLEERLDERDARRAEHEVWEAEKDQREAELRAEQGRLS